ncbi:MAG: hypothetical protein HN582_14375 [Marinovum sp.]|jgi:hypothetical protein|nr:hypothetical protein [Marinovum sp.]MBT7908657.1 hypothetical protein [Marinovum sp.]MDG2231310.1 hypothetical protein [Paracoccaceae bacterium]
MIKTTGFKELMKKNEQMAKFAAEIDGVIATVSFDPKNPANIEVAIQAINDAIDKKANAYKHNDWIQTLVKQIKEHARKSVLEKAAAARLENKD